MPQFDKNHTKELKEFLYNSPIHDARIESIWYEYRDNRLKAKVFNPISNIKMDLTFCDIEIAFAIKGKEIGMRETIISLTVEENFSYLQNYIPTHSKDIEDSLYFLFQMFSGDELHIVSREVITEIEM